MIATLPFAPLEQLALGWLRPRGHTIGHGGPCDSAAIATLFDVDRRQVHRWRDTDRIELDAADRLAIELGRHLSEIWDDDAIEFAFVWATIDRTAVRKLRARAQRESWAWRLVGPLTLCVLGAIA